MRGPVFARPPANLPVDRVIVHDSNETAGMAQWVMYGRRPAVQEGI